MNAPIGVLTIDEAAAVLRVTRQTVHSLINRGEIRRFKVGRSTRIPATDVYALIGLADRTVENAGDAA